MNPNDSAQKKPIIGPSKRLENRRSKQRLPRRNGQKILAADIAPAILQTLQNARDFTSRMKGDFVHRVSCSLNTASHSLELLLGDNRNVTHEHPFP